MTDEPLKLVHHHPGHIRARASLFVNTPDDHPAVKAACSAALSQPGVRAFSRNPKTGSIVIQYEPGSLDADDLLERVALKAGLHGVSHAGPDHSHREELVNYVIDSVKEINALVFEATGGRADLRELLPAALGVTSAISLVRSVVECQNLLPHWDTALWWGQSIFVQWHRKEIEHRDGLVGRGTP